MGRRAREKARKAKADRAKFFEVRSTSLYAVAADVTLRTIRRQPAQSVRSQSGELPARAE